MSPWAPSSAMAGFAQKLRHFSGGRVFTERQSRFVEHFLHGPDGVRLVATQAARAAGYAWPAKQGPRLLTFPHVLAAIDAGFERLAVHVGKSREK